VLRRLILVTALAGLTLAACSNGVPEPAGGDPGTGSDQRADDTLVDPIVAEGTGLGSCAFEFSLETLRERQFAFDGTVTQIRQPEAMDAPYEVDFEVATWFRGGEGTTATVGTYDVSGTSLAGELGLAVGDRVLASGDEGFLWGCGFSMAFSEEDATLFGEAFGP
jgi:hypothetical protein